MFEDFGTDPVERCLFCRKWKSKRKMTAFRIECSVVPCIFLCQDKCVGYFRSMFESKIHGDYVDFTPGMIIEIRRQRNEILK